MPSLFTSESLTLLVSLSSHTVFYQYKLKVRFSSFPPMIFFFFNIKFFIMDLWLICFKWIYPCVIGFPCAVLFDNFVLFGFTIPVQCIIFWYFMALVCFGNPISFCFNQWSLGLVQSVELATPNSLVRSEEAFKGFCIEGTFSFVSFWLC